MPPEFEFVGFPSSPFGTQGYFDFCESVAIEATFAYDVWVGPKERQIEHLGNLLRHGVPLLWQGGAQHVEGLNVPFIEEGKPFHRVVNDLLKPHLLLDPYEKLEVKSAKIGIVRMF